MTMAECVLPMLLRRCRPFFSALAVAASASFVIAQPATHVAATGAAPLAVVSGSAPVEVRDVIVTPAGVSATLVNRSSQSIAGYVVGLTYSSEPEPQHFEAMTSNWGAQWSAGAEISLLLSPRPSGEPARVIVQTVVLADGTGYGDQSAVDRIRGDWDRRRSGLSGALALLDEGSAPATEEDLQALIDRIALTMARVPVGRGGESQLQPYVQMIAGLKRLQGRDLAGSERLTREMSKLADTMRHELAAVPGGPASVSR
jgi:hypothetical protein